MERTCPEYRQLLGEYQRALQGWAQDQRRVMGRHLDRELEGIEATYQRLADHQQRCPICVDEMGYGDRSGRSDQSK